MLWVFLAPMLCILWSKSLFFCYYEIGAVPVWGVLLLSQSLLQQHLTPEFVHGKRQRDEDSPPTVRRLGCSSPPPFFFTLSNNWLVFLDRGKAHLRRRGSAEGMCWEQPAGTELGWTGPGVPSTGSVAGAVCVPLGALCSVCVPISGLQEQTGKWFFCSLIAAHKQSTSFSRCCSQRQR